MPAAINNERYAIVWLVRRLFRALAQKSADSLEGMGISVADRAVMEFLHPDARLSVPEIAANYQVSRQHVQATVNSLLDKGLVAAGKNPRHKRSPLIALTPKGRKLFGTVLDADAAVVDALFAELSKSEVEVTRQTLQHLFNKLK